MLDLKQVQEKLRFNRIKIIPALRKAGEKELADRIEGCGQYSQFATCVDCGTRYYVGTGGYCNSRFCGVCAKRRALAWLAKLMPKLQDLRKSGYLIFFLNLTIKDQSDLQTGLDALVGAWRMMTNGDKFSRKRFKELNNGGIKSIEVKLGANSGIWHPHIHAIVILKSDKPVKQYEEYRELWERATRSALHTKGKVGSVYIHGIKDKDNNEVGDVALLKGVVETFKYICKFDWLDLPPKAINELVRVVKGRRLISSWGELYRLSKEVDELLNETTEEQLKHFVCEVCGCTEYELDNLLTETQNSSIKSLNRQQD